MKKIVITGGAGFIGSHLTQLCLTKGHRVVAYDNLAVGKRKFLPKNNNRFTFIKGDILDSRRLRKTLAIFTPEIVFHLAAIHHIPTCEKFPERTFRVNIEGTQSLLSSVGHAKKIVFASTGATYKNRLGKLSEKTPQQPLDTYGLSKFSCEKLLALHVRKHPVDVVVARLFNTVGPNETNHHVIPDIMDQLREGRRSIELGNLKPRRDYIHVEDVAEALYALSAVRPTAHLEAFNVGTGHEYSVKDIIAIIAKCLQKPLPIKQVKTRMRKVDRLTQRADIMKITMRTSWKPRKSLEDAIHDVLIEQQLEKDSR